MPKGKGDSTKSEIKLPLEIEALAKRNLTAAENAGKIGFVPYQGPTVAALTPMQINSMKQNSNAMRSFGLQPGSVHDSIPRPTTYAGGVQGYDPMALYTQAKARIAPHQQQLIGSPMFVNKTGQPVHYDNKKKKGGVGDKGGGGGGGGGGNQAMVMNPNTGQMVAAQASKRKTAGGK